MTRLYARLSTRVRHLTHLLLATCFCLASANAQDLVITGAIDGPLSGGVPKGVELYVINNITDLSEYGLGSANNGGGTDGEEFTFPAESAVAGSYLYVASEEVGFTTFFGFGPDYTAGAMSINGDDAIELFQNGTVVDVFGDIAVDGTGEPWDHVDGWAYRNDNTGPDGTAFQLANWSFSGPNALDGESSNDTALTPFPIGTYSRDGGAGDNAPLVVGTTPANGAGAIALDSNIDITFSEPVDVVGSWFAIDCTVSGLVTAAVTGGPQSFALDPDVDFANDEQCTVTVFATQVSDVDADDPPDQMAEDFSFSFITEGVPLAASIVINEIMQNPSAVGDGSGEWIELTNVSDQTIDINGWTVADNDNDSFVINAAISLAPGGFAVLSNNGDSASNGGVVVDYEYSGTFLSNSSDEVVLFDAAGIEIDRVEWDNGATFPDPSGASMALIDTNLDNNLGANWCTAALPFGDGDAGTPRQVNDCGFRPIVNEVDYDQPGSDAAEFVEIRNNGAEAGDLGAYELVLINGNGGSAYQTFALPSISLESGELFVVCANAAAVVNCDLDVNPDTNLIQNGAPDAVAIREIASGMIVDAVSYEGDLAGIVEGSGAGLSDSGASGQDFKSISRLPNGFDANSNNTDFGFSCVTPGTANTSLTTGCTAEGPVVEIYELQGAGLASPFEGEALGTNDNIVTAVGPEGFFIQTPAARTDGLVDTSDGIYVFTNSAPTVAVGDQVDVRGTIVEFFGFTEISNPTVLVDSTGNPVPAAIEFDAAIPSPDPLAPSCAIEFECYEGMLVNIAAGSVTEGNQSFGSDPIAEVFITAAPMRSFREPGIEFPGLTGLPIWDGNPEVFELDPNKLGLTEQIIPGGSSFAATGVIGFEFGGYELWPTELTVVPNLLPQPVRARGYAELSIGSLNLFRLFDDVADGDETVVGSDEYAIRLTKFSSYIREVLLSPDILAVQEVEKLAVLQDLADLITMDDPSVNYTPYLEEGNDVGGIDVGFLVRDNVSVSAITQLGADELLSFDGSLLHDRPPLLLEGFSVSDAGEFPIRVMVVHNRSLGGIESERTQIKRLEQAQSIADKVQSIQLANDPVNLVVTGDFNAFEFSDSYVDVVGQIAGSVDPTINLRSAPTVTDPALINQTDLIYPKYRYSFIFRGNAQTLDHALTSADLDWLTRGVEYGRGNADAAEILIDDDTTPERSSDHDGLVLYLLKDSDGDSITDDVDQCPATTIPETTVPSRRLKPNRWALVDGDTVFDTVAGGDDDDDDGGSGPIEPFTLVQTRGCSCEQIIEIKGAGRSNTKFGCKTSLMKKFIYGSDYDDDDDDDDD